MCNYAFFLFIVINILFFYYKRLFWHKKSQKITLLQIASTRDGAASKVHFAINQLTRYCLIIVFFFQCFLALQQFCDLTLYPELLQNLQITKCFKVRGGDHDKKRHCVGEFHFTTSQISKAYIQKFLTIFVMFFQNKISFWLVSMSKWLSEF